MSVTEIEVRSRMLTRIEAAEYLGLQPQTLAVWATSGRNALPYFKVGRSVKYRLEDLDAWLESRSRTSTGQGK